MQEEAGNLPLVTDREKRTYASNTRYLVGSRESTDEDVPIFYQNPLRLPFEQQNRTGQRDLLYLCDSYRQNGKDRFRSSLVMHGGLVREPRNSSVFILHLYNEVRLLSNKGSPYCIKVDHTTHCT